MERVGADIAASDRWQEVGQSYADTIESAYQRHRLAVIKTLLPDMNGNRVVDFGCGEGVLIREAKQQGASVVGIDIDQKLLAMAENSGAEKLYLGGVEQLSRIERADLVIAANVAAYFTKEEDSIFYENCRRLGADLVITHSNELFDMFTFNAFTVDFYERNFCADIAGLVTNPNKPNRSTFNVRENPLAYPAKLASYGYRIASMEFMNLHAKPPLLTTDDPDDMARERPDTLHIQEAERWKLMFQCSMFGVLAIRN